MADDERQPVVPAAPAADAPVPETLEAWQPFTPRGIAAIAHASTLRLLGLQLVVALLAAGALMGLLLSDWFPMIQRAIRALPDQGRIEHRQLRVPLAVPTTLAENPFLAFVVDAMETGRLTATADVRVCFLREQMEICSLFGCRAFPYPAAWTIEFNRPELEPWWGAWQPFLIGGVSALAVAALFLTWFLLALLYCPGAYLLAFYADRDLTWAGAWRLAAASLLPGAVLMTLALLLYGSGMIRLLHLGVLLVVHLLVGWIYVLISPWALPRRSAAPGRKQNPFAAASLPPRAAANPFAAPGREPDAPTASPLERQPPSAGAPGRSPGVNGGSTSLPD